MLVQEDSKKLEARQPNWVLTQHIAMADYQETPAPLEINHQDAMQQLSLRF